jgi:hypothetical protein
MQRGHAMKTQTGKFILIGISAIVFLLSGLTYVAIRAGYMPAPEFMSKQPAPTPTPAGTRDERWQQAVTYLGSQLPYLHVNPFFKVSEADFTQSVDQLYKEVPNLNDEQIVVGLMQIIASIGDGHTRSFPEAEPVSFPSLPLEMRWLDDGLIVVAASPEYEKAVGAKVIQIGAHPVEEVFEAVKPLIAADNDMEILNNTPHYMAMPAILYGLGLIPQKNQVTMYFEVQGGSKFQLELQPASNNYDSFVTIYDKAGIRRPLYEQDRQTFYWYRYLKEENTVYVQYNVCAEQKEQPFQTFMDKVFGLIDQHEGARLVLDMRFNGGGNEAVLTPFIKAIQSRPSLNASDRLFVIIGRGTYSSALQNAITLSREANAVLVGEPTSGKPNHYGEVRRFRLPNIGLLVQYSTRYWLNDPESDPLTLEPDLSAPVTFSDLLAGRDPALEAALQP